jgi:hypothetical protein
MAASGNIMAWISLQKGEHPSPLSLMVLSEPAQGALAANTFGYQVVCLGLATPGFITLIWIHSRLNPATRYKKVTFSGTLATPVTREPRPLIFTLGSTQAAR